MAVKNLLKFTGGLLLLAIATPTSVSTSSSPLTDASSKTVASPLTGTTFPNNTHQETLESPLRSIPAAIAREVLDALPLSRSSTDLYTEIKEVTEGEASWYDWDGSITASGEAFDSDADTCAHKTIKLGSYVEVTNLANGRKKVLRVNDRGPYKPGRIVDVSKSAAESLGFLDAGITRVHVRVISRPLSKS